MYGQHRVLGISIEKQRITNAMLGSVGMLRVLGGVFHDLRAGDNPAELDDITEFFKRLDRHMTAPVTEHSIWRTSDDVNADFELNAAAPIMRGAPPSPRTPRSGGPPSPGTASPPTASTSMRDSPGPVPAGPAWTRPSPPCTPGTP